jgi:ribosome-associated protein
MDIRKLQRAIVDGLEDVKAQGILVFDTEHLSPLFERVVIASGASNRQTKALASSVRDAVKAQGFPVLRTEGEANGEWIIVDCGAAVVHVMQPAIREYYHLEEIWGDKQVKLKLDTSPVKLVKAETPEDRKAAAKKTAARNAPDKSAPAKKVAAKKAAPAPSRAPARKVAAKKGAAKSASVATKAPASKVAAKKVVAKKASGVTRTVGVKSSTTASRKPATKTSVTRTTASKAAPAKKVAAKKTTGRK